MMARKLTTDQDIDGFLIKVIGDARHHDGNVSHVIPPLSDEVRKRLNLNIDKVEVYERNGACPLTLQGARYAFSYNYQTEKTELRDRSIQGTVRFEFDNATTIADILTEVGKL